jgi:transcriptional regulator with XRE-family HTH domain
MPKARKSIFAEPYIGIIRGLTARRRELGLTQWDVARHFGEDQSFVSRIERLQRRLDVHEYAVFCGVLNLEPARLIEGITAEARKRMRKGRSGHR